MLKKFRKRAHDERGAVAVLVAMTLSILLLAMSVAVDIGYQRTKTRDMQALADMAALDLSRRLTGRTEAKLEGPMQAALQRTLERNGATSDTISVDFELGTLSAAGEFTPTASDGIPNAVRVDASQTVRWGLQDREETSSRSAIAQPTIIPGYDCFRIGSYSGIAGTPADAAIQSFFQKLGQKASIFSTTSTIGNLDYYSMMDINVNLTGVAYRLGYPDIKALQQASVPLKQFYRAVYYQQLADYPDDPTTQSAYAFWQHALSGAPSMPMNALMGPTVSGDVQAGLLDVLGGSLAWHNGGKTPINPDLGDVPTLKNATGSFYYNNGARIHCGKPGETFMTAPSSEPIQMEIETNGTLDPVYYPVRFYSPGLIDVNTSTGSPANFKIFTELEPMEMSVNSISCKDGVKTASFNVHRGNAKFFMGQSWSVGMNNLNIWLQDYGPVKLSFKAQIGFNANVTLAPSTRTVSATEEDLNEPMWMANPNDTLSWDPGTSYFSNFSISGASVSAADQKKIQDAIIAGLVEPLMDVDYEHSLSSIFLQALLGTSGYTLSGPSIMFGGEELTCGMVERKTVPRLVG